MIVGQDGDGHWTDEGWPSLNTEGPPHCVFQLQGDHIFSLPYKINHGVREKHLADYQITDLGEAMWFGAYRCGKLDQLFTLM